MSKDLRSLSALREELAVRDNEKLLKIRYTKDADKVQKIGLYYYLKMLEYEGLIPKGYITRYANGHIKYHTVVLKVESLKDTSKYFIRLGKKAGYNGMYLIGLVERV